MPFFPVFWNVFQMAVLREDKSCGLCAPSCQTGEAIRCVAHRSQVVRNRLRPHSEFVHYTGFIPQEIASAIELHDASADNTLTKIFIGRANEDLADPVIVRCLGS